MSTQRRVTQRRVGRTWWLAAAVVGAVCLGAAPPVQAGARIDLRPTPPMPPGGYAPYSVIDVDVFMVDTGNPDGDILFRLMSLDFGASTDSFTFPGRDRIPGTMDDNEFSWFSEVGFNSIWPYLPQPSWYHGCEPSPCLEYMIVIPDNGEAFLGSLVLNVGSGGGILDALNVNGRPDEGAWFVPLGGYSFFDWRSTRGDLTGGQLEIIVPEPASISIVLPGVLLALSRTRKPRRVRNL